MQRVLIPLVAFAAVTGASAAVMADQIPGSKVMAGHWDVNGYEQDGRFSHCAMSTAFKSGVAIYVSLSKQLTWRLGWRRHDWKLSKNQSVNITANIDDNGPYNLKAVAVNDGLAVSQVPNDLVLELNKGVILSVQIDDATYRFGLGEMHAALTEILNCVERHQDFGSRP